MSAPLADEEFGQLPLEHVRAKIEFRDGVPYWRAKSDHPLGPLVLRYNGHLGQPVHITISHTGYPQIRLGVKQVRLHRIVWAFANGRWPKELDHINGDRTDYRIENLREVTRSENCRNRKVSSLNTSGATGVYWSKRRQKWFAEINLHGRAYQLGTFSAFEDAVAARQAANEKHGFTIRGGQR